MDSELFDLEYGEGFANFRVDHFPEVAQEKKPSNAGGLSGDGNLNDINTNDISSLFGGSFSPTFTDFLTPTYDLSIVPSPKERGEPYFITDEKLTTKKDEWIQIDVDVQGLPVDSFLKIYERYSDTAHFAKSVMCHKKCPMQLTRSDLDNSSFIFKTSDILKPNVVDGIPIVEVPFRETTTFHIAYRCRNTCDSHKMFGRNRNLVLEILNNKKEVIKTRTFSVRVCETPRRDHPSRCAKRKSSQVMKQEPRSNKSLKLEPKEVDYKIITIDEVNIQSTSQQTFDSKKIGNQGQKKINFSPDDEEEEMLQVTEIKKEEDFYVPKTIIAKMKSEADENAVLRFIQFLKGEATLM